ncbi:hypothetical protein F0U60_18895 [Archangium minus]|uniref:Uncharacterized protein n=1 Tax=Archangium minus TaxID=83450 RepID=A0ABY9WQN0_9BACT|nr:hypothetical protein F0U60_18895 [Archangium minus]
MPCAPGERWVGVRATLPLSEHATLLDPRDRRDLACLGLMVLVYGLAVAPVIHAVVAHGGGMGTAHERAHAYAHAHGHAHAHAGEQGHEQEPSVRDPGHQHPVGSVEHLLAVAVTKASVLAPVVRWHPLRQEVFRGPLRLPGVPLRLTAMPQGP